MTALNSSLGNSKESKIFCELHKPNLRSDLEYLPMRSTILKGKLRRLCGGRKKCPRPVRSTVKVTSCSFRSLQSARDAHAFSYLQFSAPHLGLIASGLSSWTLHYLIPRQAPSFPGGQLLRRATNLQGYSPEQTGLCHPELKSVDQCGASHAERDLRCPLPDFNLCEHIRCC
jgi:hypothetical protein